MSKQIVDLQELRRNQLADDDLVMVRDVSENRDKKATIGSVMGRPKEGWMSVSSDTLAYVSYDSASKIGKMSCNAGGLTRYAIGMRMQFDQGTKRKYAVIIDQTDTSISVLMLKNERLENAPITGAQVSQSFSPQTDDNVNFFGTLMTGQIDGLPVVMAVKAKESDPDVPPVPGCVVLEAILGDEV